MYFLIKFVPFDSDKLMEPCDQPSFSNGSDILSCSAGKKKNISAGLVDQLFQPTSIELVQGFQPNQLIKLFFRQSRTVKDIL
jgi:hypothetical protein